MREHISVVRILDTWEGKQGSDQLKGLEKKGKSIKNARGQTLLRKRRDFDKFEIAVFYKVHNGK